MDKQVWPKAVAMHFNTVIAPVYWEFDGAAGRAF
jgi:hypothetical protein